MKISGKKLKMTQIFKVDRQLAITPVKIDDKDSMQEFKVGDLVKVRGLTKGKGFSGVVKRHGFHGGPKTHGQKNRHRAPGSIGSVAPQRVLPGRRMAGRMGGTNVTVKNLEIVGIEIAERLVLIKGATPAISART